MVHQSNQIDANLNANIPDFYRFNLKLGAKKINKKEGIKRIVKGIDYFRCLEDPLVFNNLELIKGLTLLDIGSSNTIFPLFVSSRGVQVWATDIDNHVLELREDAKKLEISNFRAEIQDARKLSYPDNHFDRVCAISTLEHIPNNGDTLAVKEMSRVLRRGGGVSWS